MLLILTNANATHSGQELAINTDLILSIVRDTVTREDGVIEEVTCLFIPPHGTWEVRESVAEIVAQINAPKKGCGT